MSSIDADVALRGSFAPGSNSSSRFRDYLPADRSDDRPQNGGPHGSSDGRHGSHTGSGHALPLNLGVGWIEVLRPKLRAHTAPESARGGYTPRSPDYDMLARQDLAPMRGIMLGVALGASFWALIGGLIGILFLF